VKKASILVFLILLPAVFAVEKEFKVIPGVGIGLQKNFDEVDFKSGDEEKCVLYHVGNPSSTDAVVHLVAEGNLSTYFTRNDPEEVFVPSGTFRYNSTCCLIPIYICFKFPYTLEKTSFDGIIRGVYTANLTSTGAMGSVTGSSVAYKLTINILPPDYIELKAGEKKCINFYKIGEKCFSAPYFVFQDYEEIKEINGYKLKFKYRNNLLICVLIISFGILSVLSVLYFLFKRRKQRVHQLQQTQSTQSQQLT
jgi:hypothetical protein